MPEEQKISIEQRNQHSGMLGVTTSLRSSLMPIMASSTSIKGLFVVKDNRIKNLNRYSNKVLLTSRGILSLIAVSFNDVCCKYLLYF